MPKAWGPHDLANGKIPWFPTDRFDGATTRAHQPDPGARPSFGGPTEAEVEQEAWECADCGWNVAAARLLPGWTMQDARLTHSEKYCGRPPTWPPS